MDVEKNDMTVVVTAVDLDNDGNPWSMGESLHVEISPDEPVLILLQQISAIKDISVSRMKLIVPPDRVLTSDLYDLSLRRSGINRIENQVELRPTTPGVWQWHSIEYYEQAYINELKRIIGDQHIMLKDLIQIAKKPPVLRMSTRVFLRKYPDLFLLQTSLVSNLSTVSLNTSDSIPLFY